MNSIDLRPAALGITAIRPSVADYPAGATYGPMTIGDFELVWMLRGVADWTCDDGRAMQLRPGVVLLVPPGSRHHFTWDRRRACRHGYIHFRIDSRYDRTAWPLTRHADPMGPLPGMLGYLLWLGLHTPEGWESRVGDVLALLLAMFVDGPLPEVDAPIPDVLNAALTHVRYAWSSGDLRPLSLGELASSAAVSPSYLARQFHSYFGLGFVTALEHLRLARAASLLLRSNYSLSAIARTCGFADQYHFSRRFRSRYGVAPSAYRKLGADGGVEAPFPDPTLRRLSDWVWPT
ncbi:MAG TPA: AraC family transcriptional regulator [Mycobacteriales bacterium]|nr:AraC family transcriptional regulator [Mycobacteriales bacterium]